MNKKTVGFSLSFYILFLVIRYKEPKISVKMMHVVAHGRVPLQKTLMHKSFVQGIFIAI